jgi:hypothetical protein
LLKKKEVEDKQATLEKRRSKYSPSLKVGTRKKETTNTGKPPLVAPGETQEKNKKDKVTVQKYETPFQQVLMLS